MKSIGGYFELELNKGSEFYSDAITTNTGRNALEYILIANNFNKIYIPFYTCDVILQPINKIGINYQFYKIDKNMKPIFDFRKLKSNEAFLYTNYFGLQDGHIKKLVDKCQNLIIDNAQAFYSKPIPGVNTFYSPRKFFGVPDGGYLFSNKLLDIKLKKDSSYSRFQHLLMRIDNSPEYGFKHFNSNEEILEEKPIMVMSNLTKRLLSSIDYNSVAETRISNFNSLHKVLKKYNLFDVTLKSDQVPMVYPFLTNLNDLRLNLIKEKIYTPLFWSNVLSWTNPESIEYKYANQMVFLPVDQRYSEEDMNYILFKIKSHFPELQ